MKSSKKPILSIDKILTDKLSPRVTKAYNFAKEVHGSRMRFSGKPYLHHVVESANILLTWLKLPKLTTKYEDLIIAALLHDSIEYENVSPKSIQKKFGTTVKNLVLGVSDLRSDGSNKTEVENLKYIAKKGHLDPRVFVIKLADRLHNMRTHKYLPRVKQIPKARETMNVYVPLAEAMGMWMVKKELEDISFSYLNKKAHIQTKRLLSLDPRYTKKFSQKYKKKLLSQIADKANYSLSFNKNGLWTVYNKKIKARTIGSEDKNGFYHIDDALTVSIVMEKGSDVDLYKLLGKIHTSKYFANLVEPKKINDYIASPRPNKYSALQTILNLPEGKVEINLVTRQRKDFNDQGIISLIKMDLDLDEYRQNIVFDEEQNAWFMPLDSTYLDYVYKIGVGPYANKIYVNGKLSSLDKKIRNGAIVSIILSDSPQKLHDQNKYTLPSTKAKIEQFINLKTRDMMIIKGRKKLEKVLKPLGLINVNDVTKVRNLLIHKLLVRDSNELYFRVGISNIKLKKITEILVENKITKKSLGVSTLRVSGQDKPGLLNNVTQILVKLGGNIVHVAYPRPIERKKDKFTFRILFKGLDEKNLMKLKTSIQQTKDFKKVEVV